MKYTAENRVKVGAAGGIETVIKAINTHTDNAHVYLSGCGALWSVTINNGKIIRKANTINK